MYTKIRGAVVPIFFSGAILTGSLLQFGGAKGGPTASPSPPLFSTTVGDGCTRGNSCKIPSTSPPGFYFAYWAKADPSNHPGYWMGPYSTEREAQYTKGLKLQNDAIRAVTDVVHHHMPHRGNESPPPQHLLEEVVHETTLTAGQQLDLRSLGRVTITFSTPGPNSHFYAHVESTHGGFRHPVFAGQGQVLPDGKGGLGPYSITDPDIRKLFIQMGADAAPLRVRVTRKP